jgi:hypothetical protein
LALQAQKGVEEGEYKWESPKGQEESGGFADRVDRRQEEE